MKECAVPKNIAIGEICRRILGTTKESCYLWHEVNSEPPETVHVLEPLASSLTGCPFQKEAIGRTKTKGQRKKDA